MYCSARNGPLWLKNESVIIGTTLTGLLQKRIDTAVKSMWRTAIQSYWLKLTRICAYGNEQIQSLYTVWEFKRFVVKAVLIKAVCFWECPWRELQENTLLSCWGSLKVFCQWHTCRSKFWFHAFVVREFLQTTTAARISPNKRFNEKRYSSARAFWIFVHFFAIFCKTTTWNDQVLCILENVNHNNQSAYF